MYPKLKSEFWYFVNFLPLIGLNARKNNEKLLSFLKLKNKVTSMKFYEVPYY